MPRVCRFRAQLVQPGALATFTEKKVSDIATLNNIAAFKLQKLNNPSNGNSLECLISQVATWHPGQYVSASRPDLELVGSFIIQRITKQVVSCSVEVDAAMPQMDILLQDTDQYGDLGVYQAQPTTQTPNALVLQGLLHLYHLTDGSGTTAADDSPNGTAAAGTITNGAWINGAIKGTSVLGLSGNGYVDCPVKDSIVNYLAIGCWYSPTALINLGEMMGRGNSYIIELVGTSGAVRFGLHIGGNWVYLNAPAGSIAVGARGFIMGVYDGTTMYLYISNPNAPNSLSTYSQAQTGTLDTASGDLYIGGSLYQGVVAEAMVWSRSLSSQEVQELFFQPLLQVVGGGATSGWVLTVTSAPGGTPNPSGIINVGSAQSQVVSITILHPELGYSFAGWMLDGKGQGPVNPITVPAQTDGSTHTLMAQISSPSAKNTQIQVINIPTA